MTENMYGNVTIAGETSKVARFALLSSANGNRASCPHTPNSAPAFVRQPTIEAKKRVSRPEQTLHNGARRRKRCWPNASLRQQQRRYLSTVPVACMIALQWLTSTDAGRKIQTLLCHGHRGQQHSLPSPSTVRAVTLRRAHKVERKASVSNISQEQAFNSDIVKETTT